MNKIFTTNTAQHPRFIDVVLSATLSLWICSALLILIYGNIAFDQFEHRVLVCIFLLLFGAPITMIYSGVICGPLWLFSKKLGLLTPLSSAAAGTVAGLIIGSFYIFLTGWDFSGLYTQTLQTIFLTVLAFSTLGGLNGWIGFSIEKRLAR